MGRKTFTIDWLILLPVLILIFFGLLTIASTQQELFLSQLIFVCIGFVLYLVLSNIDYQLFKQLAPIFYPLSFILLGLTLFGPEIRGSTRWLIVGSVRIQASELVKPLLLISFSLFFSQFTPEKIAHFLISFILLILPTALLFFQPDLGNVIIYLLFFMGMIVIAGAQIGSIAIVSILFLLFIPVSFNFLRDYQKLRLLSFLSPYQDVQGAGYNALQSIIAVGSGRFFGRGFGRGLQSHLRFLPENHTDFIFASFVEEFGFIGGAIFIATTFFLLWHILSVARNTDDMFVRIFSVGLFMQLFGQVIINIGMNVGLLPITGITLPLVSYGGSSLISTFIGVGMLSAMKKATKERSIIAIR